MRKSALEHGMFHQVRVDCGKEFYLMLGIQELYAHLRGDNSMLPYRQTQSKKNLPIERIWVEVNSRVNYPLKEALVEMDNTLQIDMENDAFKFCVSEVSCRVANYGLNVVISSWNQHPISGRGVPSTIKERTNRLQPLNVNDIPEPLEAKQMYETIYLGRLTEESHFGIDPLVGFEELINQRENSFQAVHQIPTIFNHLVNGNQAPFKTAISDFIQITSNLTAF
ncbi:uncharacterized protein [Clytia hemisphaerica]|uniref:uncharacterized protein isoform X2 n=1 Tax=Clytia hemisphaerica TaxID=252671 RepID=UPI0034D3B9B8